MSLRILVSLCSNRFKLYLIPVVYTLILFKIYSLYVLLLLKEKKNNQQPMTNMWSPSFTQRMPVALPRPEALQSLSLLSFRPPMQFFFRVHQIHEPNLLSSCFLRSLSSPLPVLHQFNLLPQKFILRRWLCSALALNPGKKVSFS